MNKKKSFGESLEAFFAGKGFYLVLFLCVAVIGVSAWAMLTGKGTNAGTQSGLDASLEEGGGSVAVGAEDFPEVTEPAEAPEQAPEYAETGLTDDPEATEAAPAETAAVPDSEAAQFFVWPVTGDIENGYSMTALAFDQTMQDWRTHDGIDIAAELGTQVRAATDGTVADVFADDLYGTTVVIEHSGGLTSTYANLEATPTVAVGDKVSAGQTIGAVGDTALCETGEATHLHFAMAMGGESVDPTGYMP